MRLGPPLVRQVGRVGIQVIDHRPGRMSAIRFILGVNQPLPAQGHTVLNVAGDPLRDGLVRGAHLLAAAAGLVCLEDDVLRGALGLEYARHRQPSFVVRRGWITTSKPSALRTLSTLSRDNPLWPCMNRDNTAWSTPVCFAIA